MLGIGPGGVALFRTGALSIPQKIKTDTQAHFEANESRENKIMKTWKSKTQNSEFRVWTAVWLLEFRGLQNPLFRGPENRKVGLQGNENVKKLNENTLFKKKRRRYFVDSDSWD